MLGRNPTTRFALAAAVLACLALLVVAGGPVRSPQGRAADFLSVYNELLQGMYAVTAEAHWKAGTDVTDLHVGERIGAEKNLAVLTGSAWAIETVKELLQVPGRLDPLTRRQLHKVLLAAAEYPGTIPATVARRVAKEAEVGAALDSFEFCLERSQAGDCLETVTPNQIDQVLVTSRSEPQRRKFWDVAKQTGPVLKQGIADLRDLRNQVAREMGYDSFFALQVADYDMTVEEMMTLMEGLVDDLRPLYEQLHAWARSELARRFGQAEEQLIPAHWIGNRWAQAWPGLIAGVSLDSLLVGKDPEWVVRQAESFYTSMGMPPLPQSFYDKSDLYPLPPGSNRKKNTHASAWHMDLGNDVRSLMSVESNWRWFETTHHELGHIYYYLAYTAAEVPLTLRGGANRAFHEAVGDLIGIAARQPAYLKEIGLLAEDAEVDQLAWLLDEALDQAVVFIPFAAGTMSFFERDLYEGGLEVSEFNRRWWQHAGRFQGIAPPAPRGEEFCDACTKTHITDDPAQYYDYALAFAIKYQLHDHIAKQILRQDPRNCSYYGSKEVGEFLWNLLSLGATRDWREVLREATGRDLSTEPMLEYFEPLVAYLEEQNSGRRVGW